VAGPYHRPVGIIDLGQRVARNLWRVPGVGSALALDYERTFRTLPRNRFRGVFPTFAAAEASIPPGGRVGYDHDELAGMYRARMDKACESDYAPLFWLRGLVDGRTHVFDLGGHVGVSYYGWQRYLGYPPGLRWTVYEVPAIARAGRELAQTRPSAGLDFTSELSAGRGCSILLVAGSLQYVDATLPELLAQIGGPLPPHVIVNKLPLYDGEAFVTVQSTGRAFHPYRVDNRAEFVAGMTTLGYQVVDDWQNREQHCEIPFTRGRDVDAYSGYYFRQSA
jgi:putative methyltransferase (TIGR04325 family)